MFWQKPKLKLELGFGNYGDKSGNCAKASGQNNLWLGEEAPLLE
jgi:hypothetical protein